MAPVAVSPRRVEWLHDLSEAYAGRWLDRRDVADRWRAETLARQCLEIDPRHSASFDLLDRLDSSSERGGPAPAARRSSPRALIWGAAAAVVLTAILVASNLRRVDPATLPPAQPAIEVQATEPEAAANEIDVSVALDPNTWALVRADFHRRRP